MKVLSDEERCTAKSKHTGERCKFYRTPGRTVCRYHGGLAGRKPTKGVEDMIRNPEVKESAIKKRYAELKEDPEILSLKSEIAILRAHLEKLLEAEEAREGGGNAQYTYELRNFIESIGKTAERHNRIMNGEKYTINVSSLQIVIAQVVTAMNEAIADANVDAATADRIRDRLGRGLEQVYASADQVGSLEPVR